MSVLNDELPNIVATASAAARKAGELMRERKSAPSIKSKLSSRDLLTEVDGMCQQIIENVIQSAYPDHGILGEESVEPGFRASRNALAAIVDKQEFLWILDPIDGTTNFVHGMPLSAVSIGIARNGQLVAGVIYDPFRDELFSAYTGAGALMNGAKIQVGSESTIEDAVVAGGSPPSAASLGPCMRGLSALAPEVRSLRLLGSAAVMLAWVACGRLTAYFEPDLHAWDSTAGAVIIQEAGGRLSSCSGEPFELTTRSVLATNGAPGVHDNVVKILVDARATVPDGDT